MRPKYLRGSSKTKDGQGGSRAPDKERKAIEGNMLNTEFGQLLDNVQSSDYRTNS